MYNVLAKGRDDPAEDNQPKEDGEVEEGRMTQEDEEGRMIQRMEEGEITQSSKEVKEAGGGIQSWEEQMVSEVTEVEKLDDVRQGSLYEPTRTEVKDDDGIDGFVEDLGKVTTEDRKVGEETFQRSLNKVNTEIEEKAEDVDMRNQKFKTVKEKLGDDLRNAILNAKEYRQFTKNRRIIKVHTLDGHSKIRTPLDAEPGNFDGDEHIIKPSMEGLPSFEEGTGQKPIVTALKNFKEGVDSGPLRADSNSFIDEFDERFGGEDSTEDIGSKAEPDSTKELLEFLYFLLHVMRRDELTILE